MSDYVHRALTALKQAGFRVTRPRQLVLSVLDESVLPLSAYDIKASLDALDERVDTVSVYRILECLIAHQLVHRLGSSEGADGNAVKFQKCQIGERSTCPYDQVDHCHHFLRCERCHGVTEVHCPEALGDLIRQMAAQSGFRAHRHTVEVFGVCAGCHLKS